MIAFPQLPPWDEFHPLVVHFPIALLLVAPLFVVLGAALTPQRGRPYLKTALLLMFLGTVAVWFAVATGETMADLVERNAQIAPVLDKHSHLGETTQTVFTIATLAFAIIVFAPAFQHREATRMFSTVLPLAFVIAYGAAALLLVNTAHQGARLVHQLGSSPPVEAAHADSPAHVQHN